MAQSHLIWNNLPPLLFLYNLSKNRSRVCKCVKSRLKVYRSSSWTLSLSCRAVIKIKYHCKLFGWDANERNNIACSCWLIFINSKETLCLVSFKKKIRLHFSSSSLEVWNDHSNYQCKMELNLQSIVHMYDLMGQYWEINTLNAVVPGFFIN